MMTYSIPTVLIVLVLLPVTALSAEKDLQTRARIEPLIETVLTSQIAAQITSIHTDTGKAFKEGDTLLEYDCDLQHFQRDETQAELVATRARYKSTKRLAQENAATDLEVLLARAAVDKAAARRNQAKKRVSLCTINAPFSGVTAKRIANPFQSVNTNEPLLKILSVETLRIVMHVPSSWVSWVTPGVTFDLIIDETGKRYNARITLTGAEIDTMAQTLEVHGEVSSTNHDLLAGMSGTALFNSTP